MNRHHIRLPFLAFILSAAPVAAGQCVLDYEAFVIRSALPDEASIVDEQSASGADWYVNDDRLKLVDHTYEKSGPPREVTPAEIEFHAFVGSVPFFRDAGGGENPPGILYASVDPLTCLVQPYQLAD